MAETEIKSITNRTICDTQARGSINQLSEQVNELKSNVIIIVQDGSTLVVGNVDGNEVAY